MQRECGVHDLTLCSQTDDYHAQLSGIRRTDFLGMALRELEAVRDGHIASDAVLMIDDSKDDADLTRLALEQINTQQLLLYASDPVGIVSQLKAKPALLHHLKLILLDINMPRMNGLDVLKELRAFPATRELTIVLMTTSDDPKEHITSTALGADAHFQKPANFADFVDLAQRIKSTYLD